jgi:histidinol-phosphate/aromatic aminotransferase/cobyric acid decarboxylase-like protein
LRIQKKLAADLFGCDQKSIIVGNGASELINALLDTVGPIKVGMPIPTFHEYVARAGEERAVFFEPDNDDFAYGAEELIEFSLDVDALVLVNPDNPSGNFIERSEVIRLSEHLRTTDKLLIVDESFVDFTAQGRSQSLIDDEVLQKNHNLLVIKSIGKSYGVPGCRLGVMASGNREALEKVSARLPVWNISSFGEFFLQVFHRYDKDYGRSIEAIIEQRSKLFDELSRIDYLRPIPSSANYILCQVLPPYTCEHLARVAIKRNCLIKDCSGKKGFGRRQYIRVTVRDERDNEAFVDILRGAEPPV